ncbi:bifunctional glutamate N-acetyltransferase/amino-acid acetyltransferase ArgJ [uncultured Mitsuokella sp.]|jgi:glutamate N-acetyltransferase / amino-acid N-acetyltransferase|uniref:bifunctional glutamate N-acetyltransferase/amino-acid acetyltransferase ArgJ n=1 Tax=uncultured Mitsuokella sp. TaxID=453120 RepID=UPI002670B478|nr:bifunctional glutamate N-acetyltransferase/amino-acid acetyltransferase ArgJ [uncultured Mitsuokella sp.]
MVNEFANTAGVTFPQGFKAAGVKAGIKKSGNLDVAVIYTEKEAVVAGTFTQNAVAAAPVYASKAVVATGTAHAIVANAGCANACTGEQGDKDAKKTQKIAAQALGCDPLDVIVASTGVIGVNLPMDKMEKGVNEAIKELSENGSSNASHAIMTTDTHPKTAALEITLGGKNVRFGVIAKGSGMIQPNMATMLCFITTDAAIDGKLAQKALSEVVNTSFNMISIDGDMSTNDMVIVMANGAAGNEKITTENEDYETFKAALDKLCKAVAQEIADDGEGATKFLTIHVTGTKSFADAKTIGMSVAKSPLVKTAFFGADPNWGRVICAVGYAGVPMNPQNVVVKFGDIPVYAHGVGAEHDAEALANVMAQHDITISIDMGEGEEEATVWTCDFSYEYVKINGEYHT